MAFLVTGPVATSTGWSVIGALVAVTLIANAATALAVGRRSVSTLAYTLLFATSWSILIVGLAWVALNTSTAGLGQMD